MVGFIAGGQDQALGRSTDELSTKTILIDGYPGFLLMAGQAHDLSGADEFLPNPEAKSLRVDKVYNVNVRVFTLLQNTGVTAVISPKATASSHANTIRNYTQRGV